MAALPGQEVIIAAAVFLGKGAAGLGTMFVNCAVPIDRVKELASAFENIILLVTQHPVAIFFDEFGEFTFGLFITQLETLR